LGNRQRPGQSHKVSEEQAAKAGMWACPRPLGEAFFPMQYATPELPKVEETQRHTLSDASFCSDLNFCKF
jgi:hypothetical protein